MYYFNMVGWEIDWMCDCLGIDYRDITLLI